MAQIKEIYQALKKRTIVTGIKNEVTIELPSNGKSGGHNGFLSETYEKAQFVGVFEVTEVGPKVPWIGVGSYHSKLKIKPIRILKGLGGLKVYNFMGVENGLPVPFEPGKKYLMASR